MTDLAELFNLEVDEFNKKPKVNTHTLFKKHFYIKRLSGMKTFNDTIVLLIKRKGFFCIMCTDHKILPI